MGNSSSKSMHHDPSHVISLNRLAHMSPSSHFINKSGQVYSEVILSLFEPNGSLRNAKSSTGSISSSRIVINPNRCLTVQSIGLKKRSKYLLKPKSAPQKFKTVIQGKNATIKTTPPSNQTSYFFI